MRFLFVTLIFFASTAPAHAKQFEVFDGQIYNGKFYPLIDMIEWSDTPQSLPHMEFHIHSKQKPVDITAVPGDKNGKPVLWLMIHLKDRDEKVCRHVLAPSHFREGMPIHAYIDRSDADYENIYVSTEPMVGKKLAPYQMAEYERCLDENASNMPLKAGEARMLASEPAPAPGEPVAGPAPAAGAVPGKNIGADYENHSVPFSF